MAGCRPRFLAHSDSPGGHKDPLAHHLRKVAARAAAYASHFGAAGEAQIAGLLHDLGKYGDLFQRRLENVEHGVDHWSAGAWEVVTRYRQYGLAAALAIAGHHVGLGRVSGDSVLGLNPAKLSRSHPLGLRLSEPDVSLLLQRFAEDGLELPGPEGLTCSICEGLDWPPVAGMVDVRMLYSTLVDADYIETEAHFQSQSGEEKRHRDAGPAFEPDRDFCLLMSHLERLATTSSASAAVKRLRSDLLKACLEAADDSQGLFTLTAPTGAGKTLSLLAFALKHAARHGLGGS